MSRKQVFKPLLFSLILLLSGFHSTSGQVADTTVYLITCGPGTDTYSIYGHSALRVVIINNKTDTVYNWGVFDFSTPNFAWKFAKGRLEYMLYAGSYERFLRGYFYEKRFVWLQKVNLNPKETERMVSLIKENLKPENIKYRYDFFYDDCSTRIRDLFENSIGEKLEYPSDPETDPPTFRELITNYQRQFHWLQFGIDLLLGSPVDIDAYLRDRMFLPIEMQIGLSEATIDRSGERIPLLQKPEVIFDFEAPQLNQKFIYSPIFLFTLFLISVIIFSLLFKGRRVNGLIDIMIYFIFSVLAVIMIFFNFFTDHQQLRWNYNIVWLNPLLILCLGAIVFNRKAKLLFRLVFFITGAFLLLHFFLPQSFNFVFYPLVLIILVRSFARAGFKWNPFSIY